MRRKLVASRHDDVSFATHVLMKQRGLMAFGVFGFALSAVASAQSTAPLSITAPALVLSYPSPTPAPNGAAAMAPLTITAGGLTLSYPSPAPVSNGAAAAQPLSITAPSLVLSYPSPSPTPRK